MNTTKIKQINQLLHKIFQPYEIRLVGGCVRDNLMNTPPKDYDYCTTALPEEIIKIAIDNNIKYIPTGLKHGTITYVIDKDFYEITTLRTDHNCDGRFADVQFTSSFEEDAKRRDFTINSMSQDLVSNKIYDYFGGTSDIETSTIRFVGNPSERIKEDYLRVLRYFRFITKFKNNQQVNLSNLNLMYCFWVHEGLRTKVSGERIWKELNQILESNKFAQIFDLMYETSILRSIGINNSFCNIDSKYSTKDVSILVRLALILDNINQINFLKLSTDEKKKLQFFIESKNDTLLQVRNKMVSGDYPEKWINELFTLLNYTPETFNQVFPVKGQDLLNLGLKPGKQIGEILTNLKKKYVDTFVKNDIILTKEELLKDLYK